MRLVDADFEEKHYLSMIDNPTPDVSENDRKTALAIVKAFRLASTVEERKTGKWIRFPNHCAYKCSECGKIIGYNFKGVKDNYPMYLDLEEIECIWSIKEGAES